VVAPGLAGKPASTLLLSSRATAVVDGSAARWCRRTATPTSRRRGAASGRPAHRARGLAYRGALDRFDDETSDHTL
jgi:hypothetical protein